MRLSCTDFINPSNPTDDYKFTGHERDDEAGLTLDYMMARNYDPVIGRFLQIDPMMLNQSPNKLPKILNGILPANSPYNYTFNSPVNFNDPNGECIPICLIAAWAVVEIGLAIYDAYDAGSTILDPNASTAEKLISGGGFLASAVLPGGGYSSIDNIANFGRRLVAGSDEAMVLIKGTDKIAGSAQSLGRIGKVDGLNSFATKGFDQIDSNIDRLSALDLSGAAKELQGIQIINSPRSEGPPSECSLRSSGFKNF